MQCYCQSTLLYENCCAPLLAGTCRAASSEALMRSRFTAYVLRDFQYILSTYSKDKQKSLSVAELEASAQGIHWIALKIHRYDPAIPSEVEFAAWYAEKSKLGLLHETSSFIVEEDQWRYDTGLLHDDCGFIKLGRNDPCVCMSGKKFKQCCMRKVR